MFLPWLLSENGWVNLEHASNCMLRGLVETPDDLLSTPPIGELASAKLLPVAHIPDPDMFALTACLALSDSLDTLSLVLLILTQWPCPFLALLTWILHTLSFALSLA